VNRKSTNAFLDPRAVLYGVGVNHGRSGFGGNRVRWNHYVELRAFGLAMLASLSRSITTSRDPSKVFDLSSALVNTTALP
jgi:hypothetical protein